MGEHDVTSLEQLRTFVPAPVPGVELKVYDALMPEAVEFIRRCPFLVLSTSDRDGNLDASPKGDAPGFVLVEDDRTLVLPDRPGNHLAYGLTNIVEQPHVGVLFVVPGTTETLRVNGRAAISSDPDLLERLAARGRPAVLAIRVEVDECFFHCSKAFLRSQLWKPETWPERPKLSFGAMFARRLADDGGEGDAELARVIDASVEEDYRTNL
jgi:PPOX class probable FMN-dependent enzyme